MIVKREVLAQHIPDICEAVTSGELIVYPTDTLYGLGGKAGDAQVIEKIQAVKKRPNGIPISVAVHDIGQIEKFALMNDFTLKFCSKFLPGSLTVILKSVASSGESIGIRVPGTPTTRALLRELGPLTATSANVHGGDDPATLDAAMMQLGDEVKYYIEADDEVSGHPSTVVDITSGQLKILREGMYPKERIEEWMKTR
jgi:L-threonylcarbamoyladenylate synthase